jgi:hypothetical protein
MKCSFQKNDVDLEGPCRSSSSVLLVEDHLYFVGLGACDFDCIMEVVCIFSESWLRTLGELHTEARVRQQRAKELPHVVRVDSKDQGRKYLLMLCRWSSKKYTPGGSEDAR